MNILEDTAPLLANPDLENRVFYDTTNRNDSDLSDNEVENPEHNLGGILTGLYLNSFFCAMDITVVASTMSSMGAEFGASQYASWIATSYLLSNTAAQPLYGKMSDIFGRKRALLFAQFFFAIGCLMCGLSNNMWQLCIGRAIAGIGGGGMGPMSSVIISDIVSIEDRGMFQGYANIVFGLGSCSGAPIGGAFAGTIGWRWVFLVQVPPMMLASFYVNRHVNLPIITKGGFAKVDFKGSITLVVGVLALLMGFSLQSDSISFTHPLIIGCFITSLVFISLFVHIERNVALEPIVPIRVITKPIPLLSALINFSMQLVLSAIIFNIPTFLQIVTDSSIAASGLALLPMSISAAIGSVFCGSFLKKNPKDRYKGLTLSGVIFGTVGMVLIWDLIKRTSVTSPGFWADCEMNFGFIGIGFGSGVYLTSCLVGLIIAVHKDDQATATGISYLFRSLGSIVGVSFAGIILQNLLVERISIFLKDKHLLKEILRNITLVATLPEELKQKIVNAYRLSSADLFLLVIGFCVFSLVCTLMLFKVKSN